jgi:hypothetical protein
MHTAPPRSEYSQLHLPLPFINTMRTSEVLQPIKQPFRRLKPENEHEKVELCFCNSMSKSCREGCFERVKRRSLPIQYFTLFVRSQLNLLTSSSTNTLSNTRV